MKLEEKINKAYGTRNLVLNIKDVDTATRKVVGYGSAFDVIDSDRDVIRKGAFVKSIQENGPNSTGNRRIAMLRNHNWDWQIGKFLELEEDAFGLRFVAQLGTSSKGDDALRDYQEEILREHSIGFNYVSDKIKFIDESNFDDNGHWEITEVKLWEVSGVTFGANEFTPVIDAAKSGNTEEALSKYLELENSFMKAIKNGKGTDERQESLEARFKQLQELRTSLFEVKPSTKDTKLTNEPNNTEQEKKELLLKLCKL